MQFVLFLVIGVMLYTYYQQTPLPRPLASNDEILPLFVVTSLSHGAAGFIVAAIVAAALSPSLNAMAATTVNDFYLQYVRPDADQATLMRVSKPATIVWGVVQIGVALGAQWITVGARRRPRRAVACRRAGARRLPPRRADGPRRRARDDRRHGQRRRGPDVGLVDRRHRLDLVRVHRLVGHLRRRLAASFVFPDEPALPPAGRRHA